MYDDTEVYKDLPHSDLWIYDKLILSKKLGYVCGPTGVDVPSPNYYIVRPITNLMGMGINAEKVWIDKNTEHLPIGYFWCEFFEGRHLSVDYHYGKQTCCVEGIRDKDNPLYKWEKWVRVDDEISYPSVLEWAYQYVNCEMIGGNIIEIHLRRSPDLKHKAKEWYPVWEGEDTTPPEGMEFLEDNDYKRLGFFLKY